VALPKLIVNIGANLEGFEKSLGRLDKTLTQTGLKLKRTGADLTKSLTVPLAAIGAVGVKSFAEFDDKMVKSLAIMGDVSDTLRKDMSEAAKEVGRTTLIGASQAAEAYFFLASAGLDATQSIAALPQVAKFAQAGAFDMAQATDLLTDAQSALGLASQDAAENLENLTKISDVLVGANTLANASVQQFSESLTQKAGGALRNLGKDLEEGVAALAVFADAGLKGGAAGVALNNVLVQLPNLANANAEAFKRLGIEVFDSEGKMRNLADIIADYERATENATDAQKAQIASQLGLNRNTLAAINLLSGNSEKIREYESDLRSMGGITDEVANKQMEGFSAQMKLVKDNIEIAAQSIGEVLAPKILEIGQKIQQAVQWFDNLDDKTKESIVNWGLLAAAIGPVLTALGATILALKAILIPLALLTKGLKLLLIPLALIAAHPIIAALGLLAAGIVYLISRFDSLKDFTDAVVRGFNVLREGVIRALSTMGEMFASVWEDITSVFQGSEIFDSFIDLVKEKSAEVKQTFKDLGEVFTDFAKAASSVFNSVVDYLSQVPLLENAFDKIKQKVRETIWEFERLKPAMQWVSRASKEIWEDMKMAFSRGPQITSAYREGFVDVLGELGKVNKETEVFQSNIEESSSLMSEFTGEVKATGDQSKRTGIDVNAALEGMEKGATKAGRSVEDLRKQFEKLRTDELQNLKFDGLKKGITDAIGSLSAADFQGSLARYEAEFKSTTIKALQEAYKISFDEAADLASIRWGEISKDYEDQMVQANKNAFRESVSFFESIFQNAITGKAFNLRDALEQVAVGFASQMAATLSGGFSLEGGVKGIGQNLAKEMMTGFGDLFGSSSSNGIFDEAGNQIGSSMGQGAETGFLANFAPQAGIAAAVAYGIKDMYEAVSKFGDSSRRTGGAIGSVMFGIPGRILGGEIGSMFGGSTDRDTGFRRQVQGMVEEMLGFSVAWQTEGAKFSEGWASNFSDIAGAGQGAFEAVGHALTQMAGVSADVAPQIGFLLAEQVGGSLDELRLMIGAFGLDLGALEEHFVNLGVTGEMTWLQVETALQGVNKLTHEGMEAVGDYTGAFEKLIESGGRGSKAIMAVKFIAIEAMEAGATSLDDLQSRLRDSGRFTEEQIAALFQALSQRGITSLEQLAGASNRELGGIVADIQSISSEFFAAAKDMNEFIDSAEKLAESVSKIPQNIQTDYRINVKVTGDKLPEGLSLNAKGGLLNFDGIKGVQNFAKGGLLNQATLMGMSKGIAQIAGEAGPEFAVPAVRMSDGNLGIAATGGGQNMTINVDARGAMPGMEVLIKDGIRNALDSYNSTPGVF
jgi:TP901 family phage tail tape measure protein